MSSSCLNKLSMTRIQGTEPDEENVLIGQWKVLWLLRWSQGSQGAGLSLRGTPLKPAGIMASEFEMDAYSRGASIWIE